VLPSVTGTEARALLASSCGGAGCHDGDDPALRDVHPGRPSRSRVVRALAGDHPGGAPALPPGGEDLVRAWIAGGALAD
jgi:hypothetical protein